MSGSIVARLKLDLERDEAGNFIWPDSGLEQEEMALLLAVVEAAQALKDQWMHESFASRTTQDAALPLFAALDALSRPAEDLI